MKLVFKILLLFVCISMKAQKKVELSTVDRQNISSNEKLNDSNVYKEHLKLIFTNLIEKNAFSKKDITILDNYESLVGYNQNVTSYFFKAVNKGALNLENANQIFFWRMDVEKNKAFYELYVKQSETTNTKYSYHLELLRGKWLIQQQ